MIINNENLAKNLPPQIKVERFDMAINFYEIVEKDNGKYLKVYEYNPIWKSLYPFYDDVNKHAMEFQSKAKTYKELIDEFEHSYKIDLNEKLKLAMNRYFELTSNHATGIVQANNFVIYELKYSKSANVYTLYKLFNYLIYVDDKDLEICKLVSLEDLPENLIENAKYFLNAEFCK